MPTLSYLLNFQTNFYFLLAKEFDGRRRRYKSLGVGEEVKKKKKKKKSLLIINQTSINSNNNDDGEASMFRLLGWLQLLNPPSNLRSASSPISCSKISPRKTIGESVMNYAISTRSLARSPRARFPSDAARFFSLASTGGACNFFFFFFGRLDRSLGSANGRIFR